MNWPWITAGTLAIVGGLAHLYLGESRIISRLDPVALRPSPPMSGDTAKRYLRWFWHVGTVNILGAATVGLVIGLTDGIIPAEREVANLISALFLGMFLAFCVVAIPSPKHFVRIPQGPAMFVAAMLFWAGAS